MMMGVGLWITAGFAAFALVRLVPLARRGPAWIEFVVAVTSALLAGVGATAMDFGGWAEPDPRAGVFTFLVATSTLALIRLIRLLRNKLLKPEARNQKPEKRTTEKKPPTVPS